MLGSLSPIHWIIIGLFVVPAIFLAFAKPGVGANRFGRSVVLGLSFPDAVKRCIFRYADFRGRSSRSEYWYFYLFNFIFGVFFGVVVLFSDPASPSLFNGLARILQAIFSLALILPNLAVAVRRFHDRNMSGWWILCAAGFGSLVLIYKFAQPGTPLERTSATDL